jgi:hypothetical protein
MRASRSLARLAALALVLSLSTAPMVRAQHDESSATMEELDKKALEKQRALFNAKLSGDTAKIERAQREFEEVQKERARLVRKSEGYR